MQWDNDYDVKEYRPKKKGRMLIADCQAPGAGNSIQIPGAPLRNSGEINSQDITVQHGGTNMTTSEILDFSEASDSY